MNWGGFVVLERIIATISIAILTIELKCTEGGGNVWKLFSAACTFFFFFLHFN